MHADVLIAEIGSTTTLMNAFLLGDEPRYLGQGMAPTTVLEGDVRMGLSRALEDLETRLGDKVSYDKMLATSSAAGGLRMSVHGLVYDMTVRAAEAAALGAGGVIRQVTGGKMNRYDLLDLKALHPNLILIAGGTDYGERETALDNSEQIAALGMQDVPVLYAGNVQNQNTVKAIFQAAGIPVFLTANVYPRLDELNIEPCRKMIQKIFEQHIVRAPGMEGIRDMVTGPILPTPGAVMEADIAFFNHAANDLFDRIINACRNSCDIIVNETDDVALFDLVAVIMRFADRIGDSAGYDLVDSVLHVFFVFVERQIRIECHSRRDTLRNRFGREHDHVAGA